MFIKITLSSYYVPDTVLGTEDVVVNKTGTFLPFCTSWETDHTPMVSCLLI